MLVYAVCFNFKIFQLKNSGIHLYFYSKVEFYREMLIHTVLALIGYTLAAQHHSFSGTMVDLSDPKVVYF